MRSVSAWAGEVAVGAVDVMAAPFTEFVAKRQFLTCRTPTSNRLHAMPAKSSSKPRGRPRAEDAPVALDDILAAALRAFARHGYEGVSVRTLNRELGVSHNLIHQRFGSKDTLWYAAVDRAFGDLVGEVATSFDPTLTDPLDQLNHAIRRFLRFSA